MALPIIALAMKLLPFLTAVPEVVEAFKSKQPLEAAKVVLAAATSASGQADPEKAVEEISKYPALQVQLAELVSAERIRLAEIAQVEARMYVEDAQDARMRFASDRGVYWLGICVLVTFAVVMGLALYGSYQILTDGLRIKDPGIVAAVFGFLGTAVGYVAANAAQVTAYFFGSSRGSNDKSRDLGEALRRLGG